MKAFFAGKIITENGIKNNQYLNTYNGKICSISNEPCCDNIINYKDYIIAPGFIDVHTHGGIGYEAGFSSQDKLYDWCNFKINHGVTSFLNTVSTMSAKNVNRAIENSKQLIQENHSNLLGVHLEGPFLSKGKKRGAQDVSYILNEFDESYKKLIKNNSSIIKYMTIAPENNDAAMISKLIKKFDIKLAAGHTEILYEDFLDKKKYGFDSITHTFNGMIGLHHRKPGLAYAGCMDEDIYAEIICDGHHICYPMLEMFFKLKDYSKIILITDSMRAAGLKKGREYKLGSKEVYVKNNGKVLTKEGGLAGSTLTMNIAVKNIVNKLNIPLADAVHMASLSPAKMLGIENNYGSLKEDKLANFIIIDKDFNVLATYIKGNSQYNII